MRQTRLWLTGIPRRRSSAVTRGYRRVGGSAFNRLQVVLPVVEHCAVNAQFFCQRRDALALFHPRSSAINWNALGYLLTRFFVPARSLFLGWV